VLVPRYPGLFAAAGLVSADLRIDESSTVLRVLEPALLPELASWYRHTAARLTGQLRRDGIQAGRIRMLASADCRFVGQGYELNIGVAPVTQRGLASLAARFRARHLQTYGHSDPAQQVEVVTLRLAATGALPRPEPAALPRGTAAPPPEAQTGRVRARMPGEGAADGASLRPGRAAGKNRVPGPAIVHQLDATTLVRWPASGPGSTPAAACGWRRRGDGEASGPARPDHVRAAQRRDARGRGRDGRGAEALELQPDHPGDGRLQLRHLPGGRRPGRAG
jgi:N-methylhydantoinase A